ncbi:hypothetical protein OV450_6417 [Actinobacteria bacterium OV450]|nr:hypothetical protein OV450_6417 [Actinobacteria bacterium OV450]
MLDALPARKRSTLFDGLRNGQAVAAAAQVAGLDVRAVFTAARTDTALAFLLAGTDPDDLGAAGVIERAEYLRLLALGCTPSLAAQILFDGAGKAGRWRQEDPVFARASDAVKELRAGRPAPPTRLTRAPRTRRPTRTNGKRSSTTSAPAPRYSKRRLLPASDLRPSTTAAAPTARLPTAPTNSEPPITPAAPVAVPGSTGSFDSEGGVGPAVGADLYALGQRTPRLLPVTERGITLSCSQVHRLVSGTPERLSLPMLATLCDILDCTRTDLITTSAQNLPARRAAGEEAPISLAARRPTRVRLTPEG